MNVYLRSLPWGCSFTYSWLYNHSKKGATVSPNLWGYSIIPWLESHRDSDTPSDWVTFAIPQIINQSTLRQHGLLDNSTIYGSFFPRTLAFIVFFFQRDTFDDTAGYIP